jgi:3alpha(or 20beta)-hydroxysteroid dehydrogenase
MGRLDGKVALITGGSAGQGAAEARLFAQEGASVVICDINDAAGTELAKQLGAKARYVHLDVADPEQWKNAVAETEKAFGALHILVNNAGTISRQGLPETTLDAWNKTFAVNVTGPMLGMQLCAPLIRKSGGGSIVNISSTAGMTAHYDAAYGASKWAVRGLTKSAAMAYVDWGIRVNSMHPGQVFDTTFSRGAVPGHHEANWLVTPLGRHGTADECAEAVLFLASDESSFITAQEIVVDGGMLGCGLMKLRAQLTREIGSGERKGPVEKPRPARKR